MRADHSTGPNAASRTSQHNIHLIDLLRSDLLVCLEVLDKFFHLEKIKNFPRSCHNFRVFPNTNNLQLVFTELNKCVNKTTHFDAKDWKV